MGSKLRCRAICHDCEAKEGELHKFNCDMERCPFCDGQLITCGCCYYYLGLTDPSTYDEATSFLPPEVYEGGLNKDQCAEWIGILEKKGRIPWIQYPNICAKCGELWPEFFTVPNEEWRTYIQADMQDQIICRSCYDWIKQQIDIDQGGR